MSESYEELEVKCWALEHELEKLKEALHHIGDLMNVFDFYTLREGCAYIAAHEDMSDATKRHATVLLNLLTESPRPQDMSMNQENLDGSAITSEGNK